MDSRARTLPRGRVDQRTAPTYNRFQKHREHRRAPDGKRETGTHRRAGCLHNKVSSSVWMWCVFVAVFTTTCTAPSVSSSFFAFVTFSASESSEVVDAGDATLEEEEGGPADAAETTGEAEDAAPAT